MKILIDIGHPAHVHLFKNMIWILQEKGYEIAITARDKDIVLELLTNYNFEYEIAGVNKKRLRSKIFNIADVEYNIYKTAKKFKPNLFIGASGNFYITFIAKLFRKPSIIFEDSEPDFTVYWLCKPFTTIFCTPVCFNRKLPLHKHIRYKGYKELAYLHPRFFKPDASILDEVGLNKGEKFTIFRFVAMTAAHDRGYYGLSLEAKRKFIKQLEQYGRVLITSELELPHEFIKYKMTISPNRIHDLLSFAHMFIGDSQTMATEASILGVPTIRSNSYVGTMSNFDELEKKYELMYSFNNPDQALEKALELQNDNNLKQKWAHKRKKLLEDKIDVTNFIVNLIEDFPKSCKELLESSKNYQ